MEMNLAQMQSIQRIIEQLSSKYNSLKVEKYLPVVKYKGHIIAASFYNKELVDFNNKYYNCFNFDALDIENDKNPIDIKLINDDLSVTKASSYTINHQYKDVLKNKYFYFMFLENIAKSTTGTAIPTEFLTDVKYLDNSASSKIDFLRLDNDPKFNFISLISEN